MAAALAPFRRRSGGGPPGGWWFGTEVDRAILGASHLYRGEGIAFDPEDWVSRQERAVSAWRAYVSSPRVAALAGTNAYEILTGLKLPRHYSDAAS